jgi:uncharacterized membrane-anchored protein
MKTRLLIAVIALQAAWVIATAARQEMVLRRGTVVLLETNPVDPRDLLRGDYVILNYKISVLPATLFAEQLPQELTAGTPVFVRLEKRGQFHEAVAASFSPLEPDAEHPVLRGTISAWWTAGDDRANPTRRIGSGRVEYGIERYYVREGTGRPSGKITVEAAVSRSGTAIIRQVYIDGKPYAEVMKNQSG